MRRITAVIICTLALSAVAACTPGQVTAFFSSRGTHIDRPTAVTVAQALNEWDRQQRILLAYLVAVDRGQHSCSTPGSCAQLVHRVFTDRGLDGDGAVRVMMCESGGNPRASNGGRFLGLFQQMASAWPARARAHGVAGSSVFDPWANAVVSAGMVAADGGWRQWQCKP